MTDWPRLEPNEPSSAKRKPRSSTRAAELRRTRKLAVVAAQAATVGIDVAENQKLLRLSPRRRPESWCDAAPNGQVVAAGATVAKIREGAAKSVTTWLSPVQVAQICLGSQASLHADWMSTTERLDAEVTLIGDRADYPPTVLRHRRGASDPGDTCTPDADRIIGPLASVAAARRPSGYRDTSRQRTTRTAQPGQRAGEGHGGTQAEASTHPSDDFAGAALAAGGYFWWRSVRSTEPTELSASGAVEAQQYQVASVIAGRVTKVAVVRRGRRQARPNARRLGSVSTEAASGPSGAGREGCQRGTQQCQGGRYRRRRHSGQGQAQPGRGRSRSGKSAARLRHRDCTPQWCGGHTHDQCRRKCRSRQDLAHLE